MACNIGVTKIMRTCCSTWQWSDLPMLKLNGRHSKKRNLKVHVLSFYLSFRIAINMMTSWESLLRQRFDVVKFSGSNLSSLVHKCPTSIKRLTKSTNSYFRSKDWKQNENSRKQWGSMLPITSWEIHHKHVNTFSLLYFIYYVNFLFLYGS